MSSVERAEGGGMTANWRENALCAEMVGVEPRWFEPFEAGEALGFAEHPDRHPRIAIALSVCVRCPARAACLAAGLAGKEQGVWGGRYLSKHASQAKPVVVEEEVA